MIVSVVIFFVLLVTLIWFSITRPRKFPPGPPWFPIVGNTLLLNKLSKKLGGQHHALFQLSKQWNTNVLGLKLGRELIVVVFTYPLVKEVFFSEDYDSKPDNFFMKLRCLGSIKGITVTDGEFWTVQRSFLVNSLRRLGFGKKIAEQHVQHEVNNILSDIDYNGDTRIREIIAPAVINVLWSFLTGTGLSRKDARLNQLLNLFQRRGRFFDLSGGILAHYPWLRYIAPNKTGYNLIKQINEELKDFFMKTIEHHHQTWKFGMDSDFIYAFISEMKKENPHYSFTDDQLLMVCLDIFIAGAQTTSTMLDFAFLMMLHNPDIQTKVQDLLDKECYYAVNYGDRHKVPYIEAVLLEVERYCTIAPLIGPRKVVKDTTLGGHIIPKNTTVLMHVHSIHTDPVHWPEPEKFKPERFLTSDGKVNHKSEVIPFGLGKRRCMGESLARSCIFIFFAEILKSYSIIQVPGTKSPGGTTLPGIIMSAEYTARFVRRKKNT